VGRSGLAPVSIVKSFTRYRSCDPPVPDRTASAHEVRDDVSLQTAEPVTNLEASRTQSLLLPREHMIKRKAVESRWQAMLDIASAPAGAHLPAAVPTERRNLAARHALLCRIHSEFEEMPGLSLTLVQAARLFGLPHGIASRILDRLTDARVLRQMGDGQFALGTDNS